MRLSSPPQKARKPAGTEDKRTRSSQVCPHQNIHNGNTYACRHGSFVHHRIYLQKKREEKAMQTKVFWCWHSVMLASLYVGKIAVSKFVCWRHGLSASYPVMTLIDSPRQPTSSSIQLWKLAKLYHSVFSLNTQRQINITEELTRDTNTTTAETIKQNK